mmetsp:Transcript_3140/g.9579  ORF Transcript_3140/g.9579 Transcript_3140/m.9579 type:complete len:221 (+) Transcript_3140:600-1262(+)
MRRISGWRRVWMRPRPSRCTGAWASRNRRTRARRISSSCASPSRQLTRRLPATCAARRAPSTSSWRRRTPRCRGLLSWTRSALARCLPSSRRSDFSLCWCRFPGPRRSSRCRRFSFRRPLCKEPSTCRWASSPRPWRSCTEDASSPTTNDERTRCRRRLPRNPRSCCGTCGRTRRWRRRRRVCGVFPAARRRRRWKPSLRFSSGRRSPASPKSSTTEACS